VESVSEETRVPEGMARLRSADSVEAAYARLREEIVRRGLTIFAEIDFARDAAAAGLSMPASRLLVFGNPRAGTPLLQQAPTLALDLPLKVAVWQDVSGQTWVGYNTPEYLVSRHQVPEALLSNIAGIRLIAKSAAGPDAS
jgi:uncharacterized protein (DUF302 family)